MPEQRWPSMQVCVVRWHDRRDYGDCAHGCLRVWLLQNSVRAVGRIPAPGTAYWWWCAFLMRYLGESERTLHYSAPVTNRDGIATMGKALCGAPRSGLHSPIL